MFTDNKEQSTTDQVVNQEGVSNPSPASQDNMFADLLNTITNDKGEPKYADVPNALKGLAHSQQHISSLEAENIQLKEQMAKLGNIESALDKLTTPQEPTEQPPAGLDEQAVAALLERKLQEKSQNELVQNNQSQVVSALTERFGDKAGEEFTAKAQSLGMTKQQLESLSATSPSAVLALFGAKPAPSNPTTSSVNSLGFQPNKVDIPTIMDGGEERINLPAGEKSVLAWASTGDVQAEMNRHKQAVYAKYGLTI